MTKRRLMMEVDKVIWRRKIHNIGYGAVRVLLFIYIALTGFHVAGHVHAADLEGLLPSLNSLLH